MIVVQVLLALLAVLAAIDRNLTGAAVAVGFLGLTLL